MSAWCRPPRNPRFQAREPGNKPQGAGHNHPQRHVSIETMDHKPSGDGGTWTTFELEALPHADRLLRLAMWFERNRQEAEDLVQETMVQALRSFHRFQPGTNCRAWLITILQNLRSNRRRARQRSPIVEDPDDRISSTPFVPPIPQSLTDEQVLAALSRVPERFQEVIVLCDVEDLLYKEIAAALAIPLGYLSCHGCTAAACCFGPSWHR